MGPNETSVLTPGEKALFARIDEVRRELADRVATIAQLRVDVAAFVAFVDADDATKRAPQDGEIWRDNVVRRNAARAALDESGALDRARQGAQDG